MVKSYILPLEYNLTYINGRANKLVKPNIHTDIEIPKSRSIHMNILNMVDEDNYESLNILHTILKDKMYVYNVENMHNPTGKLRFTKKNIDSYKRELKKHFDNSRIVEDTGKININSRDLMLFNYKSMYINTVYQVQILKNKYIVDNALNTLVHNINNSNSFLHNLVMLDVPVSIPSISNFKTYSDKDTDRTVLTKFPELESLVLLELWNMMFEDRDSIFRKLDKDRLDRVYLVFRYNGKYTIYRLNDLMSLSKELDVDGRFVGKPALSAAKILIVTIALFKQRVSLDDVTLKSIDGTEIDIDDIDDFDIDSIIDDVGLDIKEDIEIDTTEETTVTEVDSTVSLTKTKSAKTFKTQTNNQPELKDRLVKSIDTATSTKSVSGAESIRLLDTVDTQLDNVFEINGTDITLGELLDYSNVDNDNRAIPMPKDVTVLDLEMLDNSNINLDKQYMKEMYHKDVFNAIYSVQNSDILITDHTVEKRKSYLGEAETHTVTLRPLNGTPSTVKFHIPVIDPEVGTYHMSGNEYIMRYQRKDLGLRKTSPTTVLLTSYTGKLFIEKNVLQKNNPSIWLKKTINSDDRFTNIIMKKNISYGLELLKDYTIFGSEISRFKFNGVSYIFDYDNRLTILDTVDMVEKVKQLEKEINGVFIGVKGSVYIFMGPDGDIIQVTGDKSTIISPDVFTYFNIATRDMPNEFAVIKILNRVIPLGIILLYYMGIDKLQQTIKVTQRFYPSEDKYKPLDNEFAVELSNGKLIFDKKNREATLVFSGIPKELSKTFTLEELNNKSIIASIFNLMELPIAHSTYIDSIEDVFLDNITKDTLKNMGEPTDMYGLLLRAVELLVDDNYKNPNNITDNSIVRYERVAGMINKVMSDAVKSYNSRNVASKARITIDPYAVWKMMGDDSTSMLVSDNNPIDTIKQRDNVTYLGEFGRSKITMTIPSRVMTPEEIGIISEATPDSGDSGINVYLTHNASISNTRGMVKPIDMNDHSINKALSTANILNPFIVNDD